MAFSRKDTDELLARTGRRCCICGTMHRVQLHHITPKGEGGGDEVENAIPLCPNCHDDVHGSHASGRTTRAYTADELRLHVARTIRLVEGENASSSLLREIKDSLDELKARFDQLDSSQITKATERISAHKGADGLFVVPKLSSVAASKGITDPFGTGYVNTLETTILAFIASQRPFRSMELTDLAPGSLRIRESAASALRKLEAVTPGDFLVFPAQTGKKYSGYSVRNAVWEIEHSEEEFALPSWCVASILLTDPERFPPGSRWLGIDCAGDEYREDKSDAFNRTLSFSFDRRKLHLHARRDDRPDGRFGCASGWAIVPS